MRKIVFILLLISVQNLFAQDPFSFDNGTTRIKVGGFVQAVVASDFGGAIANHDFVVSSLAVPGQWEQKGRFNLDASASRVNLDVTHKTNSIGDIKFFIETDFRGASNVLRLRHAYISVLGITAGQTWTFMYDGDAMAPTIDIQGVTSRTFFRTPLVGYTYRNDKGLSIGISVEFPTVKMGTANHIVAAVQTIPDVPLFVQYKSAKGHIKFAGVFRTMKYGDSDQQKFKTKQGWGAQLTGSFKPVSTVTFTGQGIYGKGIARYINDLAALSLDMLPEYEQPGKADVLTMFGASVGLRADVSKKVYVTSNFSISQLDKNEGFIKDSDYRRSYYFSASLFWKVYQNLLFASEYLYGYRLNMNDVHGNANRIQALLRFSF